MTDFEELLMRLPDQERVITRMLRSLILAADPRMREKFSYGVPYFFHHRMICFVWPFSQVPAGYPQPTHEGVTLGFCYGNLLANSDGMLQMEKRKQVGVVKFSSTHDIHEREISVLLQEAIIIDESFRKSKQKRKS
jgi:hypothetical protein